MPPSGSWDLPAPLPRRPCAASRVWPSPAAPAAVVRARAVGGDRGTVDYGFVALENSIEGTVSIALDQLVFERDLIIVGEVVLPVTQNLLALPGPRCSISVSIVSFPHATGQCRAWLTANLPDAEEVAARSTAEAVRLVAEGGDRQSGRHRHGAGRRAVRAGGAGPEIEDQRRQLDPLRAGRPPTMRASRRRPGTTRRAWCAFSRADHPGSLHGILGQFSARDLNLVKLESRPTKRELGEYCFIIDFEGHVADEVVADCLRDLHASLRQLKFLGSYPAAGAHGPARRRDAEMGLEGGRPLDRRGSFAYPGELRSVTQPVRPGLGPLDEASGRWPSDR